MSGVCVSVATSAIDVGTDFCQELEVVERKADASLEELVTDRCVLVGQCMRENDVGCVHGDRVSV